MPKTRNKDSRARGGRPLKRGTGAASPADGGPGPDSADGGKGLDRARVTGAVREMVLPLAAELGLDLIEIQYRRESGRMVLRLFVDRQPGSGLEPDPGGAAGPKNGSDGQLADSGGPGGVTLDELAKLSRETSLLLDLADFLPSRYTLEVSSPGLDRLLSYPDDFQRYRNRPAALRLKGADGARQSLKGLLSGLDPQGGIIFQPEGARPGDAPLVIPASQLVSARLTPRIDWRFGVK